MPFCRAMFPRENSNPVSGLTQVMRCPTRGHQCAVASLEGGGLDEEREFLCWLEWHPHPGMDVRLLGVLYGQVPDSFRVWQSR